MLTLIFSLSKDQLSTLSCHGNRLFGLYKYYLHNSELAMIVIMAYRVLQVQIGYRYCTCSCSNLTLFVVLYKYSLYGPPAALAVWQSGTVCCKYNQKLKQPRVTVCGGRPLTVTAHCDSVRTAPGNLQSCGGRVTVKLTLPEKVTVSHGTMILLELEVTP